MDEDWAKDAAGDPAVKARSNDWKNQAWAASGAP